MELTDLTWGPFANDGLLGKEIERLVNFYGIKSAVETGTHQGETARGLAAMIPSVHTIEINPGMFAEAQERLADVPNVTCHYGDSETLLPGVIQQIETPCLYYLDAHWNNHFPLPGELAAIAKYDPSPIIVIHDMQVPGYEELHADPQPDGKLYDYEYVRPMLERIQQNWRVYYNDNSAQGLRIGIMFVVPEVPS